MQNEYIINLEYPNTYAINLNMYSKPNHLLIVVNKS